MLRIVAILVVGFFAILYASGNDINSLRQKMVHWADGNAADMASAGRYSDDWGHD